MLKCFDRRGPMSDSTSPPQQLSSMKRFMEMIFPGAVAVQAVAVAVRLGLADLVASGPRTVDELARATNTKADSLARLLRALVSLGIFVQDESGRFQNNTLSDFLRSDDVTGRRAWALLLAAPYLWRSLGGLEEVVRSGEPAFDQIHGEGLYEHLASHIDDGAVFNTVMDATSESAASAMVAAYDFSRFSRIVDVGGGQGAILQHILASNPGLYGVLFDFPIVVAGADSLRTAEFATRCEILGGDCRQAVPEGGDIYLIKGIIADSNDQDALTILRNCRAAIQPGGTLLIVDTIFTPSSRPEETLMDLLMMTLAHGRDMKIGRASCRERC